MALDRIRLSQFRNHRDTALDGARRFNLLVGENGAGKTNVLEALSLLAPGRGLRRAALPDLSYRGGEGSFAVSAELASAGSCVRLGTGTQPTRPGRRKVQVNGADASAVSLSDWLSVVWLIPAMDRMFAEGPGGRRRFLDRLVLALEPDHARSVARYEAALRERNRLLSAPEEPDGRWLEAIEAQMSEAGALAGAARERTLSALDRALGALPASPFARPKLLYSGGGPLESGALREALARGRSRDRAAQRTLIGPHRDDMIVAMAGKDLPAAECSTGEQKAMLIAITLAHAGLLSADRPRILLLDEVAAHLDPLRRGALFERLRQGPAQVWFTGTEVAPFQPILDEAMVWGVDGGQLAPLPS